MILQYIHVYVYYRHTNPEMTNGQVHPCQPVITEIWPVLSQACDKYQQDVRIIERCCRCIRFAIRCLGRNSGSLLTPLVTQVSIGCPHSQGHCCNGQKIYMFINKLIMLKSKRPKSYEPGHAASGSNEWGHIVFILFVCLFVCCC